MRARSGVLTVLAALSLSFGAPPAARAADVETVLPTLSGTPGSTVLLPIDVTPNLVGLGVESIQYHLPIDPAVVSAVTLDSSGLVWNWGAPFTNVTATGVDVAAFGTTPVTDPATRLHSLQLTIAPDATIGSSMVLALTTLLLNEGTPSIHQAFGRLWVGPPPTAVTDLPASPGLAAPEPNPARSAVRLTFALPARGRFALAIFGVDGRRLRTLASGDGVPGSRLAEWNLRDASGRRVPAGVYFAVLEAGSSRFTRRIAVLE
jgi:hypothetical protein